MAKAATGRSLIGSKIGNYSIASILGEGGMGVVYLAEHPQIGKQVAIKVLHPDHAARSDAAARCFLEARAVNEIRHPNVVDIIDCGEVELGDPPERIYYLLMEYLDGRSLRAWLREGPLPVARAIEIASEVAQALAAAHEKDIIHRDIKPENIFLCREGGREAVKVLDFGIAKLIDERAFGERLTQSGVALGTPQYMAPEQLDAEDVDGRVDVYALGIVLYEMLTGAAPFADEPTARGVWRRMNELPTLTEEQRAMLPAGLEELLMRTLDPDRMRRPAMADLARGLVDPTVELPAAGGDPHTVRIAKVVSQKVPAGTGREAARPKTPTAITVPDLPPELDEPPPRSRLPLFVGLAAAAAIAITVAVVLGSRRPDKPIERPATAEPRPDAAPIVEPAGGIVRVAVTTTPPGAEVFVGDEPAARGKTPIDLRLAKGSGAIAIRITRAGFEEIRRSIDTLADGSLTEALTPLGTKLPPDAGRVTIRKPPETPPATPDAGIATSPPDAAQRTVDGGLGTGLKDLK